MIEIYLITISMVLSCIHIPLIIYLIWYSRQLKQSMISHMDLVEKHIEHLEEMK